MKKRRMVQSMGSISHGKGSMGRRRNRAVYKEEKEWNFFWLH